MMLAHLAQRPDDFIGAFRSLPRQTLLLFVHAFQSHIFNLLLSERMREGRGNVEMEEGEYLCNVDALGFPDIGKMDVYGWLCIRIIGYDSNMNERERALLDSLGISKDDFRMKGIPEVASKGTFRTAFAPLRDFSFDPAAATFRFSLQSGSYATSALREFIAVNKP
jgi:tRNA pseudouridine13 synthase